MTKRRPPVSGQSTVPASTGVIIGRRINRESSGMISMRGRRSDRHTSANISRPVSRKSVATTALAIGASSGGSGLSGWI